MEELVTLASVANGRALDLFEVEFQKVLKNIADVNTSSKAKRAITIKITVSPDEDREAGFITVQAVTALAPIRESIAKLYFGQREGKFIAVASNPLQPSMFDDPNVRPQIALVAGKEGA